MEPWFSQAFRSCTELTAPFRLTLSLFSERQLAFENNFLCQKGASHGILLQKSIAESEVCQSLGEFGRTTPRIGGWMNVPIRGRKLFQKSWVHCTQNKFKLSDFESSTSLLVFLFCSKDFEGTCFYCDPWTPERRLFFHKWKAKRGFSNCNMSNQARLLEAISVHSLELSTDKKVVTPF